MNVHAILGILPFLMASVIPDSYASISGPSSPTKLQLPECAGHTTLDVESSSTENTGIEPGDWSFNQDRYWRCIRVVSGKSAVKQIGVQTTDQVAIRMFRDQDPSREILLLAPDDLGVSWSAVLPGGDTYTIIGAENPVPVEIYARADEVVPVTSAVDGSAAGKRSAPFNQTDGMSAQALQSTCHIDVQCGIAGLQSFSDAVALLVFRKSGNFVSCTGTKIGDVGFSGTPFILTANHCISTQAEADTLSTFWRYRSNSCNGPSPDPLDSPFTNSGADLRVSSASLDMSLIELRETTPPGSVALDWSNQSISTPINVATIGHPAGGPQTIAFGQVNATSTNGRLAVNLAQGVLSAGASGSAVVDGLGRIVGVLGQANINDQFACGGAMVATQTFGGTMQAFYELAASWLDPFGVRDTATPTPDTPPPSDSGDGGGGTLDFFALGIAAIARRRWKATGSSSQILMNVCRRFPGLDLVMPKPRVSAVLR